MRRFSSVSVLTIFVAIFSASSFAASPPLLDYQLKQAVADYDKTLKETGDYSQDARKLAADTALGVIDLGSLTFKQIENLMDTSEIYYYSSQRNRVEKSLAKFAKGSKLDSARASLYLLSFLEDKSADQQHQMIKAMLNQVKLKEALKDGEIWAQFMNFIWYARPESVDGLETQLIAIAEYIPHEAPILSVLGLVDIFDIIAQADPDGLKKREPLRLACIAALQRLAKYVDPNDPDLAKWNFARDIPGHISNKIARLQGPAVLGTLLNNQAPQLDFIWASGDRKIKSLNDLSGKVVVMDFWTTWCGPCIASFPNMRKLVERYRNLPVEFLGVTSLQGFHIAEGKRIDCKDDSDKEINLMSGYMKAKDMTWTVAFSRQQVFNPQYDVDGIPYVVIIDVERRVRFRKLHPYVDHDRIIGHIDELLKEAGIEPPPPLLKEESDSKKDG